MSQIEGLALQRIEQAMEAGAFRDLSGRARPLAVLQEPEGCGP